MQKCGRCPWSRGRPRPSEPRIERCRGPVCSAAGTHGDDGQYRGFGRAYRRRPDHARSPVAVSACLPRTSYRGGPGCREGDRSSGPRQSADWRSSRRCACPGEAVQSRAGTAGHRWGRAGRGGRATAVGEHGPGLSVQSGRRLRLVPREGSRGSLLTVAPRPQPQRGQLLAPRRDQFRASTSATSGSIGPAFNYGVSVAGLTSSILKGAGPCSWMTVAPFTPP